ncbi:MAG: DUF393 domain-containing protein [Solirubrobacterales bacterium]|nr:DUF393 domain-containing protein [Solirubrobacterales bacterium]
MSWRVLYDDDCGLCKWMLAGLLRWDRERVLVPVPLQSEEAGELLSDLAPAEAMGSWHLVAPDGRRFSAGAALPVLLARLPGGRVPAAAFAAMPGLTERGYRWVAEHRAGLARFVPVSSKQRAAEYVGTKKAAARRPLPGTA